MRALLIMICAVLAGLILCETARAFPPGEEVFCRKTASCYAYLEQENGEPGQAFLGSIALEHNCFDPATRVCAPWKCPGDTTSLSTWKDRCSIRFSDEIEELKTHPRVKMIKHIIVGFPDINF